MHWWMICLVWIAVSVIAGIALARVIDGKVDGDGDDHYPD